MMPKNLTIAKIWLIFFVPLFFIMIVGGFEHTNFAAGNSSEGTPPDIPPEYEELLKKARENGAVSVIIGLDASFQPEGNLTPEGVEQQHTGIQKARNQLIQALSQYNIAINPESLNWSIPYIALEIDEYALRYLMGSEYVTGIYENQLRRGS